LSKFLEHWERVRRSWVVKKGMRMRGPVGSQSRWRRVRKGWDDELVVVMVTDEEPFGILLVFEASSEGEEEEEGAPRREVILTGRLGVCLVGGKMYL